MRKRREAQSSALSFMDCICCGFGAVLLLFILTAKKQTIARAEDSSQSLEAAETLQAAIEEAEQRQKALDTDLDALEPNVKADTASLAELAAEQERLAKEIEAESVALESLDSERTEVQEQAGLDRPSADQSYLSGLKLRGPRIVILLESSGSMLGKDAQEAVTAMRDGTWKESDKWQRAKIALRAVLAAVPKGSEVAILSLGEETTILSGSSSCPYMDPYDNSALVSLLDQLERLEAKGGADLAKGFRTVKSLPERASSLLFIGDGLPTAPAPSQGGLSESYRIRLFNLAVAARPNFPVNAILFSFEGDPSAAGLFWQLSVQTNGITLIPDNDWPTL